MKYCHELKQPLHAALGWPGPLTHRQLTAWRAWFRLTEAAPNQHSYYLMQIALEVARAPFHVWGKDSGLTMDNFRLHFGEPAPAPKIPPELEAKMAKARWRAAIYGGAYPLPEEQHVGESVPTGGEANNGR